MLPQIHFLNGKSGLKIFWQKQIVSRLVGNYNICRFFGNDIRFIQNK